MDKSFDLIVIGAGPGGYVAAIKAAQLGLETAIIEKRDVGGTCLNRGCIPTKAMLHASGEYRHMLESGGLGIDAKGVSLDYAKLVSYRSSSVESLVSGVDSLLSANGVTVIKGSGRLLDGKQVEVTLHESGDAPAGEELMLSASDIILAAGSVPAKLPIEGMDLDGVLTSDGLFGLDKLPESLTIIGGGVIGVEFAQVFSDLGCRVTIIEALPRILANMDKELSQNLKLIMKKRGVDIHTSASVQKIEKDGASLRTVFIEKEKELSISSEYVLCAVGRKPAADGLFEEGLDIATDRGYIVTDDDLRTGEDGVYAIGDIVAGSIQLAHMASAQALHAVSLIAGKDPLCDLSTVPSCIYTDPEIASAGMTEDAAKKAGISVKTGKFIMSANGRSVISREERGFIKVVADAESDVILGAQMMCARATDMIGEIVTAITCGLTSHDLMRGMRAHPTYNEGLLEALEDMDGGAVHILPKKRR